MLTFRCSSSCVSLVLLGFATVNPSSASAQWEQVSGVPNYHVNALRVDSASGFWFVGGFGYGVLRSSDRGASWWPATGGLTQWGMYVYDLVRFEDHIFIGTQDGLFRSSDLGDSWEQVNSGIARTLSDVRITCYALGVLNDTLHAGTRGGAYATTDLGTNWVPVLVNGNNVYQVDAFCQLGDTLLLGGGDRFLSGPGLFRSTNAGTTWALIPVGTFTVGIFCFADDFTGLYVGTSHGIYRSTDRSASWTRMSEGLGSDPYVFAMIRHGDSLIAGSLAGVFFSTDSASQWISMTDNLPIQSRAVQCMANIDDTLYIGTENGGLWRRPLTSLSTTVSTNSASPDKFILLQNYPNPFNPTTVISFAIPHSSFVTLKVYDALGREVGTLVNKPVETGIHRVKFDAMGLGSGVYFYRLTANNFTSVRQLLLLK